MKYLLDTNTCIHCLTTLIPLSAAVWNVCCQPIWHFALWLRPNLYYGAYKSKQPAKNLAALEYLFNTLTCLPFDDLAARIYGEIRSDLSNKGTLIGPNDLIIAATALAYNTTLVTRNTKEFLRVSNLNV